jgi:hypothetical protein
MPTIRAPMVKNKHVQLTNPNVVSAHPAELNSRYLVATCERNERLAMIQAM